MDFTPEQHNAINIHDRNLIVTAGAGSGKTRVLVERFIALLDQHHEWNLTELVAITFTEKAAREMRERVRDAVRKRVQKNPEQRWRDQENLLDNARIGTIHSLCAQILRANPAQVPVDPGFEVLDENEAELLKGDAVELTLAELVTGEHPAGELLTAYTVNEVRKVLRQNAPRDHAEQFIRALENHTPASLLAYWRDEQHRQAQACMENLRTDTKFWEYLEWSPEVGFPPVDNDDKLWLVWQDVFALVDQLPPDDPQGVYEILQQVASVINLTGGSMKNWGGGDLGKSTVTEARSVLKKIRDISKEHIKNWVEPLTQLDEEAARLLFLWRDAIQQASKNYNDLKAERSALDFDDLESLTATLLHNYPDVAERYASSEFRHLLVDEFQDTNQRQRDIIFHLCGYQHDTMPAGKLFVVGDPKQSIYAFRGADVSVFHQVRAEILQMQGQEIPLSHSFRTHDCLVCGFNDLFRQILSSQKAAPYEVDFGQPMIAHRKSKPEHFAPIEICVIEKGEGAGLSTNDLRRWEAYEIAEYLRGLKEKGTQIYDKAKGDYRAFEYQDAAILFRSLSNATLYEDVFKAQGIPYLTIAGRGYYDRQEVWDMLNLLKALNNPLDDLSLASVLRSPMFGLSDNALFALRLRKDENGNRLHLWDAIQTDPDALPYPIPLADRTPLEFACGVLLKLACSAGRVTVDQLLDMALDETAYDAILTGLPDGDRRRGNLEKLLDKARASGRVSLGEFMIYMRDLSGVEPREGEAALEGDASVKIMTVHKSKGLEFPVVIIADAGWERSNTNPDLLLHNPDLGVACKVRDNEHELKKTFAYQVALQSEENREHAESKRLFYVAATRAQDYVLVIGTRKNKGSWMGQLVDILGIGDEDAVYSYEGGEAVIRHRMFDSPPDRTYEPRFANAKTGWDGYLVAAENADPLRMVGEIEAEQTEVVRHLSVTQLEELGSIDYLKPYPQSGRRTFRQSVLHDAPLPIRPIQRDISSRQYKRIIGSVVHRMLQIGATSSTRNLETILRAYAWDEGVTDEKMVAQVRDDALRLLERFQRNDEPDSLKDADLVMREVPFIYQTQGRVIHGIIDVLYQYQNQWYVLDYKTADISSNWVTWHAQRYFIQLGAYATAVEERTGSTPIVQLYYLHPGVMLHIPAEAWSNAIARLDSEIANALLGGEPS